MENRGEPQDSFVTSTNDSDDCKAAVSELSDLIESLNTDEQRPRRTGPVSSSRTGLKKVDESLPWYPNYLRLSLTVIGTNSLKALQNVISFFHHNISRDVKDAYMRPNRAAKVKVLLSEALIYFHMCFSEIKLPLEQDTYLDQMTDLVAMYIDMELKASRRGKESTKKVSCKLSSSLYTFLNSSIDHILDSVLKSRFVVKSFSEICVPVLKKILTPPFQQMYEMTYVRYVLAFKLWKRITTDLEEKKLISNIASTIVPPPRLEEMLQDGLLHDVLPPLRKNKKKLPLTLFFVTTKVNLRETIKEFMKVCRSTKHNDIAAAFDKSRFFKEHRNETNGDDAKDGSTELIDSIWTAFSNSSAIAQDSCNKATLCNNKKKKSKKKDKLKKEKKNEKKKKSKNGKHTKKKSKKKKKKKEKITKKKNKISKALLVKEINKNSNDVICPTIDSLKEKPLPDITVGNKESTDKEDPFMNNLLNVINTLKDDINEGNESNFVKSDSSFLVSETVNVGSKLVQSKEEEYTCNNISRKEPTTCSDTVIRSRGLTRTNEKCLLEGSTTPQEAFDKLTSTEFDFSEIDSNFYSLKSSNIVKNTVNSGECVQIKREIENFDVKSDCGDSSAETEIKERALSNMVNSDSEKICDSVSCKVSDVLSKEISSKPVSDEHLVLKNDVLNIKSKHSEEEVCSTGILNTEVNLCDKISSVHKCHDKVKVNLTTLDVPTCNSTVTDMEVSGECPDDDVMCIENNEEKCGSMQNDVSSTQQKYTVSIEKPIESLSSEPLSKTTNKLIKNSLPQNVEVSNVHRIEQCLSYSLKEMHIDECATNCNNEESTNSNKKPNKETVLSSSSENKKDENINFMSSKIQSLYDIGNNDFDKTSKNITELSPRLPHCVTKLADKIFEHEQGLSNKSNQDASDNHNENQISELMSLKNTVEELSNDIVETYSPSETCTKPNVSHSLNVDDSKHDYTTVCGKRNIHISKDKSKSSSFRVNVHPYLNSDYGLSNENSDTLAGEQHLQASSVDYENRCSDAQSRMHKNEGTIVSTSLSSKHCTTLGDSMSNKNSCTSSHRESPIIAINSTAYTEQADVNTEGLLNNADCDISINKKLSQFAKMRAGGKELVYTSDAASENKNIEERNTEMSSEGQCSLKSCDTRIDVYAHNLVDSCTSSFEEGFPSTNVGVIPSSNRADTSGTATVEGGHYVLGSCSHKRVVKEFPELKIKEEKMELLNDTHILVSSGMKDTSVTGCVQKDMKLNAYNIHYTSSIDVEPSSNHTENSEDSVSLSMYQMGIENMYIKKTRIVDNKQILNRKLQDEDKVMIADGKQTTSTVDVDAKHITNNVSNKSKIKCFEGVPLIVSDECKAIEKTTVCDKNNICDIKTTLKVNVNSHAHTKVFSNVTNNKRIETTCSKNSSAEILQKRSLDINRLENNKISTKTTYNTVEKLVDRHELLSLHKEEETKNINEYVFGSNSTLNTSRAIENDDNILKESIATVKTNIAGVSLKNQSVKSEQVNTETETCKTVVYSVLNISSEAEDRHVSQKGNHVYQTSGTDFNIPSQAKIRCKSLSNTVSDNHLLLSNTVNFNTAVKGNESKDKNRSTTERTSAGNENPRVTSEENVNVNKYGLVTTGQNVIENRKNNYCDKNQVNCSSGNVSKDLKHTVLDLETKVTDGSQQVIHYCSPNTESEDEETPKVGVKGQDQKLSIFVYPEVSGDSQHDKNNFSKPFGNKLCNVETPDRSRGNICRASGRTNNKEISKGNSKVVSSYHQNSSYITDKADKIKCKPVSVNEHPVGRLQSNTNVLTEGKEMYESEQKNKEVDVTLLKANYYSVQKDFSEDATKVACVERKQSITASVNIVSQNTVADIKQKKEKTSGVHNPLDNGNLRKSCSKSGDSRGVKCKSNVIMKETESKLNRGLNVQTQNNSVWKMINLESPNTLADKNNSLHSQRPNVLPETSSTVNVNKFIEKNGSDFDRESVKQPLLFSRCQNYDSEDECTSTKSGKTWQANTETLNRNYVPVKDTSSSFKMKFVKVPVEKGTDEVSHTINQQKQFVVNVDINKCGIKLDSELLSSKIKKCKRSSLRRYKNEQNEEHINSLPPPHDANIRNVSLRAEENNNNKKLSHIKRNDGYHHTQMQDISVISGAVWFKPLTTTAKEVPLHPGINEVTDKLCNSSEKVKTTEGPLVDSYKKLSKSYPDSYSNLSENSSKIQDVKDRPHDDVTTFSKEKHDILYDAKPSKTKRKRKHSARSHRKDHGNNNNNVFNSNEAIPVLNLMKLPNNQWSDKAKLGLEPYVKLKKLTEHELSTLTNHALIPNSNRFLVSSGNSYSDNKVELEVFHEQSLHEEINEEQIKELVDMKRAKLSATFIKVDQEWRIAEPAAITVEIQTDDKLNKDINTEKISNGMNEVKLVSRTLLTNVDKAYHTEINLNNNVSRSKNECDRNVQTDNSVNILPQNTKLRTCILQNTASEKNRFISQPNSDSHSTTHTALPHNSSTQTGLQYMKNISGLTQNTGLNQAYVKCSLKESTLRSNLPVRMCEAKEQNYVHELSSDSSHRNSVVKHSTSQMQQPVKSVMFLRQLNSDQTSETSSTIVPNYMSHVSSELSPAAFSRKYSTYSDSLQTDLILDKPHCQRLNERDNYHINTSNIVLGSTDNFGGCNEERQNNNISVSTNAAVNSKTAVKNEFKVNSCNVSENSLSPNNRISVNNCPESSSLQHSISNQEAVLHDWTVSNPVVPETPLDYTVTQAQPLDSWTVHNVLDSESKNSNDSIRTGTNEIQDLSKLQQVSTDIKTYSEFVDRKLNEEKLNIHLQTVNSDYNVCCSQMKYKEYLSRDISHTAAVPYPPQIPGDAHHPVVRCCCQQCCRNYHVLINNYNKLVHYRNSKIKLAADKKQRETGEVMTTLERDYNEPDSSLPLKKRKTLTQSTTDNKIESYPNTPMISIAELELANYSRSKRIIAPNPSVQLYSRLGTESASSQYVARTSDWNFQNCTEDQNHLPVTPTESDNLGGHGLINFVAQNNASQYIINGQEETARVKREMKRQKQSLRNEWRIWRGA